MQQGVAVTSVVWKKDINHFLERVVLLLLYGVVE